MAKRRDRESPAVTTARTAAQVDLLERLCKGAAYQDRAACRRRKAALPVDQYQAFVGAAQQERAEVLAGLEVAGHSVSKHSRELVAAGIDGELAIIADLRGGHTQEGMEFEEGKTQYLFDSP